MNNIKKLDKLTNEFEKYLLEFWNYKKEKLLLDLNRNNKPQSQNLLLNKQYINNYGIDKNEKEYFHGVNNFLEQSYKLGQEKVIEENKYEDKKDFYNINLDSIKEKTIGIFEKIESHINKKLDELFEKYLWDTVKLVLELHDFFGKGFIAKRIASNELKSTNIEGQLNQFDYLRKKLNLTGWKMRDTKEDDKTSELCDKNQFVGWIKYEKDFPSGHFAPPGHVNCRCDLGLSLIKLGGHRDIKEYNKEESFIEDFYSLLETNLAGFGLSIQALLDEELRYGLFQYDLAFEGKTVKLIYGYDSDFVTKFKQTPTFQKLIENIQKKYNIQGGKIISGDDGVSLDKFSAYTLGKFNYTVTVNKIGKNLELDIKITDTYDFNLELDDKELMDKLTNMLHFAQKNGYLKTYEVEVNIKHTILGD
ncbi:MAG: hypothetical protein N4A38_03695 [Candidatus Gracilibacteria bacterium]|nr:hypothetical protein [Candidatus Gracilibacteria bacterium]